MAFQPGDVVRLRSGGAMLTVSHSQDTREGLTLVYYFDAVSGEIRSQRLPTEILVLVIAADPPVAPPSDSDIPF